MEAFKTIGLRVSAQLAAAFAKLAKEAGKAGEEAKLFANELAKQALAKRVPANATPHLKRHCGYLDRVGMPHFRSGDKLARKAVRGTVGLTHARGPYAAWTLVGRTNLSERRRIERLNKAVLRD
jgi:hypothetical protein